ncbi:MAG: hypothetical protein NZ870_01265, partial [bacterium]|nr:hypothetical protein [bacterium]
MLISILLIAGVESGLKYYLKYKMSIEEGDYDNAKYFIEEAIKYSPDSAFLHYTKAKLSLERLDIEDAYISIKKAVELSTSNPHYWLLFGEIL